VQKTQQFRDLESITLRALNRELLQAVVTVVLNLNDVLYIAAWCGLIDVLELFLN